MAAPLQALTPPLSTLFYVSRSLVDKDEVQEIVKKSRENNRTHGLTGGLLFTGKHFAQALEGPLADLDAKMRVIAGDPRHTQVTCIVCERVNKRIFAKWGMGYINDPSADDMIVKLIENSIDAQAATQLRALLLEWISDGR